MLRGPPTLGRVWPGRRLPPVWPARGLVAACGTLTLASGDAASCCTATCTHSAPSPPLRTSHSVRTQGASPRARRAPWGAVGAPRGKQVEHDQAGGGPLARRVGLATTTTATTARGTHGMRLSPRPTTTTTTPRSGTPPHMCFSSHVSPPRQPPCPPVLFLRHLTAGTTLPCTTITPPRWDFLTITLPLREPSLLWRWRRRRRYLPQTLHFSPSTHTDDHGLAATFVPTSLTTCVPRGIHPIHSVCSQAGVGLVKGDCAASDEVWHLAWGSCRGSGYLPPP